MSATPRGIRIPAASVKESCPRPLDDGGRITSYDYRVFPTKSQSI